MGRPFWLIIIILFTFAIIIVNRIKVILPLSSPCCTVYKIVEVYFESLAAPLCKWLTVLRFSQWHSCEDSSLLEWTLLCWAVGSEQTYGLHLQGLRGHYSKMALLFFKVLAATGPVMQHVTDDINPKQMHFSSTSTAIIWIMTGIWQYGPSRGTYCSETFLCLWRLESDHVSF
jgi:hypothetical protein